MNKFILLIFTVFLFFTKIYVKCADPAIVYSYDPDSADGPKNWANNYPDCAKKRQSPINIEVDTLNRGLFSRQLQLKGLDSEIKSVEIKNHALTVSCKFEWKSEQHRPSLFDGPLSSTYLFDSVHFHWGVINTHGSEHTINGQSYAMEAHFVFFNKAYQEPTKAINYPDGFAVVGVLFEMDRSTPDLKFLNTVKDVKKEGDSITIKDPKIYLRELIPTNFTYAYYKGSFTTPPCYQIVDWFVSTELQTVNDMQLRSLRQLHDGHARPLAPNFREVQNSFGRRVLLGLVNNSNYVPCTNIRNCLVRQ